MYEWALRRLHQPLTVDQLAHRAGTSRRTLIRRFHAETGRPPLRWLLDARLARARELLSGVHRRRPAAALRALPCRRCSAVSPAPGRG
ncbi:helix-turn-helix domain-containing protein [Streptomyces sp. NRRL S-448]|uniref:helix-turn-helix domain-containing protein n=1 Tax=Streptomyces sp. NRRL S-448 TaxID=1463907 RepID=UPI0035695DAE